MVFAPIGLVVTVVEEIPGLASKGRSRLEQRAATAKLVGQFAVAQGRRRMQTRSSSPERAAPSPRWTGGAAAGPAPVPGAPGSAAGPPTGTSGPAGPGAAAGAARPGAPGVGPAAAPVPPAAAGAPAGSSTAVSSQAAAGAPARRAGSGAPHRASPTSGAPAGDGHLAIPGLRLPLRLPGRPAPGQLVGPGTRGGTGLRVVDPRTADHPVARQPTAAELNRG